MTKTMKALPLALRLSIGATLLILVPALIAGVMYTTTARKQTETAAFSELTDRAVWRRNQFTHQLDSLWREVRRLADELEPTDPGKLRERLTLLSRADQRFSWIGYADVQGKVIVSSNGMLEGADVGKRPWFTSGLKAPFAGDVHEAVLLKNLLPRRDEPYRFIDFAAPIKIADGTTVGVLGAHLDWKWVKDTIDGFSASDIETMLISQSRQILHGPARIVGQELSGGAAVAAAQGEEVARIESTQDGGDYLTVSLPIASGTDAPVFGWSLLLRRDASLLAAQTTGLTQAYLKIVGAATLVSLLLIYVMIYWNVLPVSRNAAFAEHLADKGEAGIPPDPVGCDEAARLAVALTKLQSLVRKEQGGLIRKVG